MSSAEVFAVIAGLPQAEKTELIIRLGRETTLLEDWRDVVVFDARRDEETVSLDDHLRQLCLDV